MASQFAPLLTFVFLTLCYQASCNSTTNSSPNEAFLANTTKTVIPAPKIVNGNETMENEFPWRCYLTSGNGGLVCGCSLIAERWVLTAAHCTTDWRTSRITVYLGSHDRYRRNRNEQRIRARYVISHPNYSDDDVLVQNDIALIRLWHSARITSKVYPITLPFNFSNEDFTGETGVTSGWGVTEGRMTSRVLRKTTMKIISNGECSQSYGMNLPNNLICGMKWRSSACFGDSGGSIDIARYGTPYIIGITSWGNPECDGTQPTVFTRVTTHLQWLQKYIGQ